MKRNQIIFHVVLFAYFLFIGFLYFQFGFELTVVTLLALILLYARNSSVIIQVPGDDDG